jgi:hypothetical protein
VLFGSAVVFCFLSGCGTPGAPLPPSLNLPAAVADLAATRTGNQVALSWTMPRRTTDKLLLKEKVPVRVCRQTAQSACETAAELLVAPATQGSFSETLPAPLAAGEPRALSYFVELKSPHGRSAGLSNAAVVLAGHAPQPIEGLSAEMNKEGVLLRWSSGSGASQNSAVRLHRTLLSPPLPTTRKDQNDLLAPAPEPVEQNLFIKAAEARGGRTLDAAIRFGQTYEYRAQRVARVTVDGKTLELAGEFSAPVRIAAVSAFPPAVPSGLAAVASQSESGSSIDLSWQPDTELDLAGYMVYRREAEGDWKRLSDKPSLAPAFHDAQVQPGHSYRYAVSAVGQNGHESARSAEAQESVPER